MMDVLANVSEQYALHFYNQPRITRYAPILEALIDMLQDAAHHTDDPSIQTELNVFQQEYDLIQQAQKQAGKHGLRAALLKRRLGFIMHTYQRHFAGQERYDRDLGLLQVLEQHVARIDTELTTLGVGNTTTYAILLRQEYAQIIALRAEKPELLGMAVNTLLHTFERLFVDRKVLACTPASLWRLIEQLLSIKQHMQQHIDAVDKQISMFQDDYNMLIQAHAAADANDILQAYGAEIDTMLQYYNQENYAKHILAFCDRLSDIEMQLSQKQDNPNHQQTYAIVADVLTLYIKLYDQINTHHQPT